MLCTVLGSLLITMGPLGFYLSSVFLHALIITKGVYGDPDRCPDGSLDFEMGDSCLRPMEEPMDFDEAVMECNKSGGRVPITRSEEQRIKLHQFALSRGWNSVWMGAMGDGLSWIWDRGEKHLQFQGCWKDSEEPTELSYRETMMEARPEDCIHKCSMMREPYASVQRYQYNQMICRCGDFYGDPERVPIEECKLPCLYPHSRPTGWHTGGPTGATGPTGPNPDNDRFCGGIKRQLLFLIDDQPDDIMPALKEIKSWARDTQPGDCAVVTPANPAKWKQYPCNSKRAYICQYDNSERSCNDGSRYWIRDPPACISVHDELVTWFQAKELCWQKNRGFLLEVKPRYLRNFNDNSFPNTNRMERWIGLTRQTWMREDGDRMPEYNGWANAGQPNYQSLVNGDECVAASRTDDYRWHNTNCNEDRHFFCEYDPEDFPTTEYPEIPGEPGPNGRPPKPPPPPKDDNQLMITAAIGAGVGITVVLLIIGAFIACRRCRKRENTPRELSAKRGPLPDVPKHSKSQRNTKHRNSNPHHSNKHHPSHHSNNRRNKAASNRYVTSAGTKIPIGVDNGGYVMSDPPMKILNRMSVPDPADGGEYEYIDHPKAKSSRSDRSKGKTYESLKSKGNSVKHVYVDMPGDRERKGVMPREQDEYFVPIDPYI